MNSIILALLLAGTSQALKMSKQQTERYHSLVQSTNPYVNQCDGAVKKLKDEPASGYTPGQRFTDTTFTPDDALGWS